MIEPLKDSLWKKLSEIGIDRCPSPEERRYVSQLNIMSTIIAMFCLVLFVPSLLLPPAGYEYLTAIISLGSCLLFLGTLHFQARSQFLLARLYFMSSGFVVIGAFSLILGRHSLQHLYFLTIGVGSFYVFPPSQRRYIAIACIGSTLAILGVEAYFSVSSYQGLLDQHQAVIARWNVVTGFALMMISIALVNYVHLAKAEKQAFRESEKNENILKQIFPRRIFERMKMQENRQRIAERYESASVMFIDIVGFTELSAKEPPDRVLIFLDHVFEQIDAIVAHHHLEKIKTIGDAYLLAGGLRELHRDETEEERGLNDLRATAACGLAILQTLQGKSFLVGQSHFTLSLRLGIHYGPIVAGVFGNQKFSYDIWGDTVNTANRMQTLAKPGSIQITRSAYEVLSVDFECEQNGELLVKGKGLMQTYTLISACNKPKSRFPSLGDCEQESVTEGAEADKRIAS